MRLRDSEESWRLELGRQPEATVMPCECGRCGAMPAPRTNISGDARRRCIDCYRRGFFHVDGLGRKLKSSAISYVE